MKKKRIEKRCEKCEHSSDCWYDYEIGIYKESMICKDILEELKRCGKEQKKDDISTG